MDDFVPRHVTLKIIELLGKCRCELCQKEKKKLEDKLYKNYRLHTDIENPEIKECNKIIEKGIFDGSLDR